MALFTFYLCQDDGTAATFEVHEAHSDAQARAVAELILAQHATASYVNLWDGERKVGRVQRLQVHQGSQPRESRSGNGQL